MELAPLLKSIIDQDPASVIICDAEHAVVYMNPAAVRVHAEHGSTLAPGQNILDCHTPESSRKIQQVVDWFRADQSHNRVFIAHRPTINRDQYMVALRDEGGTLIGYYEKHEYRNPETGPLYDLYD